MRFSFFAGSARGLAVLGLAATLFVALGAPTPVAAQSSGMDEADKKALMDYKLTLEKVDKVSAVCKKIVEAARTDPQVGKEVQALRQDQDGTFEQINAVFTKQAPHVLAIIKGEGLEAREYMLGLMSMMFARIAVNVKASGAAELPDFIPPANVELAEKNKAKFDEANKVIGDMDAIGKPPGL